MGFFNSLPVPELREWNYPFPFPFPNSQMSFPLTPVFYGHTRLSGHKVGMLSPKKDELKPLGRFNSKLYTKSNYIGVRARTPCTFWVQLSILSKLIFCVNKLWIKWKWTLYDQYTLKGHELNLYCIKKLPAYELVRRALLSRAILTCIRGGGCTYLRTSVQIRVQVCSLG